eukprot:EG_transcript_31445
MGCHSSKVVSMPGLENLGGTASMSVCWGLYNNNEECITRPFDAVLCSHPTPLELQSLSAVPWVASEGDQSSCFSDSAAERFDDGVRCRNNSKCSCARDSPGVFHRRNPVPGQVF